MIKKLLLLILLFCPFIATGQVLVNLSNVHPGSDVGFEGVLGFSTVTYDSDTHTYEANRKILGLGAVANITSNVNLLMQLGYDFEGKIDDNWKGKGYFIGGGLNAQLYRGSKTSFIGYGLLNYIAEEYKHVDNYKVKFDFSDLDLHVGALLLYRASPSIAIYGGPDLVIYSKGTIAFKHAPDIEIERSKNINIKLGMDIFLNKAILRPEITFVGEKTLILGVGFNS
jgi:hypothetical protein